jgi:serine/threonine-protein kinase
MTQPLMLESNPVLPPPARLGEVLGKYRLDRILATGGMGVVVGATHLQLDQRVAIKFMSPLLAGNDTGIRRFMLEARSAASIRSEHVARVLDVETLPSGTPYIVMEYLEGEDLRAMLDRRGWLRVPEAVDYVLQACEAIAEAHVMGIVHRDLKPGNLFCCKRPDGAPLVKVLDFGVSKLLPRAQPELRGIASTGPHVIMGTPRYASPEQLRSSARVDARTDIWALGVILYELIAGRTPFQADTFLHVCAKVAHTPIQPLRALRPEVPTELGAAVERCLAKDPDARFQTVADLADALAPHAPRGSLVSVERVENILRGEATVPDVGTVPDVDPTLRSASSSIKGTVPPTVVTGRRTIRGRSRSLRIALGSLAGGLLVGALIATWIASASPPSGTIRTEPTTHMPPPASSIAPAAAPARRAPEQEPGERAMEAPLSLQAPPSLEPSPEPSAAPAAASSTGATPLRRRAAPRRAPGTEGFGGLL